MVSDKEVYNEFYKFRETEKFKELEEKSAKAFKELEKIQNELEKEYPPTRTFTPQKDITAYELAIILPYLVHGTGGYIYWYDNLPPECQRHFTEV